MLCVDCVLILIFLQKHVFAVFVQPNQATKLTMRIPKCTHACICLVPVVAQAAELATAPGGGFLDS